MHIVIMGCGRVGSSLARGLECRGHSVAVIDVDVDAFRRLGPEFSGRTVKGVGFDRDVLVKAGIVDAGGFAAVSSGDNSNILAARVVREEFGVHNVVARIYDQGRAEVYEKLGIPTVATVRWAAGQVMNRLLPGDADPVWRDPSGLVALAQMPYHERWVGVSLTNLQSQVHASVPFMLRGGRGFVPSPSIVIQDGDLIWLAVDNDHIDAVASALSNPPTQF